MIGIDCVDNLAALRAVAVPPKPGAIFVRGRKTVGDGGEGLFFWDPTATASENNLTITTPGSSPPTGRWVRQGGSIASPSGTPSANRGDTSIINVRWFGAKGDGATPDHAAIQEALDYMVGIKRDDPPGSGTLGPGAGMLYFPPGRYLIHQTLEAGSSIGVRYQGGAVSRRALKFGEDNTLPQSPSVLVWQGPPSEVMFRWSGNYCVFDSLTFQGGWDSDPRPPAIGFLIYSDPAIATGKAFFPNIQFNRCIVGFQVSEGAFGRGDPPVPIPGCDTCSFGRFGAESCDTGFKVKNDQGQGFVFQYAKFDDVGTCFDFERGGGLDVQHLHSVRSGAPSKAAPDSAILRIRNGGPSASAFRLGFVFLDGGQTGPVVWVKHTVDRQNPNLDFANVTIEGGIASAASNQGGLTSPVPFQLAGRAVLHVRNIAGGLVDEHLGTSPRKLFQLTGTAGRGCVAMFENCGLNSLDPDVIGLGEFAGNGSLRRWQLRDCFRSTAMTRVADIGNLRAARSGTAGFTASGPHEFTITVPHNIFGASGLDDGVVPRVFVTPLSSITLPDKPPIIWVSSVSSKVFVARRATGGVSLRFGWRVECGA